jgi:hypothetical protein
MQARASTTTGPTRQLSGRFGDVTAFQPTSCPPCEQPARGSGSSAASALRGASPSVRRAIRAPQRRHPIKNHPGSDGQAAPTFERRVPRGLDVQGASGAALDCAAGLAELRLHGGAAPCPAAAAPGAEGTSLPSTRAERCQGKGGSTALWGAPSCRAKAAAGAARAATKARAGRWPSTARQQCAAAALDGGTGSGGDRREQRTPLGASAAVSAAQSMGIDGILAHAKNHLPWGRVPRELAREPPPLPSPLPSRTAAKGVPNHLPDAAPSGGAAACRVAALQPLAAGLPAVTAKDALNMPGAGLVPAHHRLAWSAHTATAPGAALRSPDRAMQAANRVGCTPQAVAVAASRHHGGDLQGRQSTRSSQIMRPTAGPSDARIGAGQPSSPCLADPRPSAHGGRGL